MSGVEYGSFEKASDLSNRLLELAIEGTDPTEAIKALAVALGMAVGGAAKDRPEALSVLIMHTITLAAGVAAHLGETAGHQYAVPTLVPEPTAEHAEVATALQENIAGMLENTTEGLGTSLGGLAVLVAAQLLTSQLQQKLPTPCGVTLDWIDALQKALHRLGGLHAVPSWRDYVRVMPAGVTIN